MRKLIRQYEEKNKIIEEIQKNLRMVHSKSPRPERKNKQRLTSLSFQLDLPTINVRHEYTPKSHNSSPQKNNEKSLSLPIKDLNESKIVKRENKPWIQTISFKSDGENQTKALLLINHRTTMRNFMRLTSRSISQSQNQSNESKTKQIFLSTSKFSLINKQQLRKQQKKLSKKFLKSVVQDNKNLQMQKKVDNICSKQKEDHSKFVIQQIMSSQLAKKQKQVSLQGQQINLNTINTVSLSINNRYRRQKKKNNRNQRTYSPWNAENESQQIAEIWNAYN